MKVHTPTIFIRQLRVQLAAGIEKCFESMKKTHISFVSKKDTAWCWVQIQGARAIESRAVVMMMIILFTQRHAFWMKLWFYFFTSVVKIKAATSSIAKIIGEAAAKTTDPIGSQIANNWQPNIIPRPLINVQASLLLIVSW